MVVSARTDDTSKKKKLGRFCLKYEELSFIDESWHRHCNACCKISWCDINVSYCEGTVMYSKHESNKSTSVVLAAAVTTKIGNIEKYTKT